MISAVVSSSPDRDKSDEVFLLLFIFVYYSLVPVKYYYNCAGLAETKNN